MNLRNIFFIKKKNTQAIVLVYKNKNKIILFYNEEAI